MCTRLEDDGISVVLSRGAAVSIYSEYEYESYDLDFIPTGLARMRQRALGLAPARGSISHASDRVPLLIGRHLNLTAVRSSDGDRNRSLTRKRAGRASVGTRALGKNDLSGLARRVDRTMASLGFERRQRHWVHPRNSYWVEFSTGPVSIGKEVIHEFAERHGPAGRLRILRVRVHRYANIIHELGLIVATLATARARYPRR